MSQTSTLEAKPERLIDEHALARVLTELAEIATESLQLQDVFGRVATSIRRLFDFDHMGVVRIVDGKYAVAHATTVPCDDHSHECSDPQPLSNWSPRLRPRPGPIALIRDVAAELDPEFPFDRELIDKGVRSTMWEPFRMGDAFPGGVWLCSERTNAFSEEHQTALRPIAALLGSSVEHWRLWDGERRRRERLDRLEDLLGDLLAGVLDVRDIFDRVCEAMQPVLAHDALFLSELDEDRRSLRIVAGAGKVDVEVPRGSVPLTATEAERRFLDFEILADVQEELAPDSERNRLVLASGMRSWLRVPILLGGEVNGSLVFLHREPGRFSTEDVEVGKHLADRMALALSHHRLAEEATAAEAERQRAARLEATVESLTEELASRQRGRIVGNAPSWKATLNQVGRVASSETTVLITGESGTGKEVIARLIHQGSPRSEGPFVAVNCAALPEQLLESELFGHERGAFTGATATKMGRIEQAEGGSLFLDEIGEMDPVMQAKLLRVLEQREFQRLGGTETLKADVRVVTATNRDLARAIEQGSFREDLYYRLNVFEISTPALRDRAEDILLLADTFLEELGRSMGRSVPGISRDARDWLLAYSWPGNVRELRNAIERAILLCDGGLITRNHLPAAVGRPEDVRVPPERASLDPAEPLPPGGVDLDEVERGFVERALKQTQGNKAKASRLLGLTRAQLYSRLDKYGLR